MSPKKTKKAREPERDYSRRSLLDKLGVKPGQRVYVLSVEDAAFLKDLATRVPDFSSEVPGSDADMIFFSAEDVKELERLKTLARDSEERRYLGDHSRGTQRHSRCRGDCRGQSCWPRGQQVRRLLRHAHFSPLRNSACKSLIGIASESDLGNRAVQVTISWSVAQ